MPQATEPDEKQLAKDILDGFKKMQTDNETNTKTLKELTDEFSKVKGLDSKKIGDEIEKLKAGQEELVELVRRNSPVSVPGLEDRSLPAHRRAAPAPHPRLRGVKGAAVGADRRQDHQAPRRPHPAPFVRHPSAGRRRQSALRRRHPHRQRRICGGHLSESTLRRYYLDHGAMAKTRRRK